MTRRLVLIVLAATVAAAIIILSVRRVAKGPDPNRWTPLIHAVHNNEASAVRSLIESGANLEEKDGHGKTALMFAAGYGYTEIVRLLLDAGADPYAKDVHQGTALDFAVNGANDIDRFTLDQCQAATVRALLERAPDLRPSDGFLDRAMRRLKGCSEVERLLAYPPRAPSEEPLPQTLTIHLPGLADGARPLEMILIPAGEFAMGSTAPAPGERADWPAHRVTLAKAFYIGKFEITQAQWRTLMDEDRSRHRGSPDLPVEKVTWETAQDFLDRISALGFGRFRLPTEAEWEYAARAGATTRYFFGDHAEEGDEYMWWAGNNTPDGTKEVGGKLPNPWGLYDMLGNVSEWCADRWEPAHSREPQTDPIGPLRGARALLFYTNRVFRGGCFRCSANEVRSAARSYEQSMDYHYTLGLRAVRDID